MLRRLPITDHRLLVSAAQRLHDPERVLNGTAQAIERARSRGVESVDPDDLLAGMLLSVSRFGIVDLGTTVVDLFDLGLRFDLPAPDACLKPRYTTPAAAVFDLAARIALADGSRLAPIHLLVALGDPSIALFARLCERCAIDTAGWRRALAAVSSPTVPSAQQAPSRPAALASPALDALLTPDEAARTLGVHIQTIRAYIRGGKLPAFRVAGERAIRIRRDDLNALLEHLNVMHAPPQPVAPVSRPSQESLDAHLRRHP
ncbi:MAG: Helix-turn-helix domain [Pseudomonadota bacterium]|jgi:excisionase family DNA binding protein